MTVMPKLPAVILQRLPDSAVYHALRIGKSILRRSVLEKPHGVTDINSAVETHFFKIFHTALHFSGIQPALADIYVQHRRQNGSRLQSVEQLAGKIRYDSFYVISVYTGHMGMRAGKDQSRILVPAHLSDAVQSSQYLHLLPAHIIYAGNILIRRLKAGNQAELSLKARPLIKPHDMIRKGFRRHGKDHMRNFLQAIRGCHHPRRVDFPNILLLQPQLLKSGVVQALQSLDQHPIAARNRGILGSYGSLLPVYYLFPGIQDVNSGIRGSRIIINRIFSLHSLYFTAAA